YHVAVADPAGAQLVAADSSVPRYHKTLVTSLTALLCLTTFSNLVASGAFPAVLPDIARSAALADWQLGLVAGALPVPPLVSSLSLGPLLPHHPPRAPWIRALVLF